MFRHGVKNAGKINSRSFIYNSTELCLETLTSIFIFLIGLFRFVARFYPGEVNKTFIHK